MNSVFLSERVGFASRERRVDRENGVVFGVKILGTKSRNNRLYPLETLRAAAPLYENAKVFVDHPVGAPDSARKYEDRVGSIRNVSLRESGLFGDFHFNPKHPLAERLIWDAERAPENLGFSHNVEAVVRDENGTRIVEEIRRVRSVDVVADPATTAGLFESFDAANAERNGERNGEGGAVGKPDVETVSEEAKPETADGAPREAVVETTSETRAERNVAETTATAERERAAGYSRRLAALERERDAAARKFAIARNLIEKFADPENADAARLAFKNAAFLDALFDSPNVDSARRVVDERLAVVREAFDVSAARAEGGVGGANGSERIVSRSRADVAETVANAEKRAPETTRDFVAAIYY